VRVSNELDDGLRQAILEHEEEYEEIAAGDGAESETADVLLSWARGEDIDSEHAKRILEQARGSQ